MIKLKYRTGLKDMPSYDVVECDWDIKVNANESNMNLPPIIEDRLMARLASVAFNRYPNEQVELLAEQKIKLLLLLFVLQIILLVQKFLWQILNM